MRPSLKRSAQLLALSLAATFAVACGQDALGPNHAAPSVATAAASNSSTSQSSGRGSDRERSGIVSVLTFRAGVTTTVTATKVIGPAGGVLALPQTGFALLVPPGAVLVPTTFSVTPVGGGLVAYDFEPHGTKFAVPLVYTQDLSKTSFAPGMSLGGGYYADRTKLDHVHKEADCGELLNVVIGPRGFASFPIKHFSGYLVSSA